MTRHAVTLARRQHVGLDAADEDRVRRLLAHEALAVAALRHPLRLDDRRRRQRRAAEVAHLALVHEVGQRAERLVDVDVRIGPVHLVEVDVVGVEPAQAVLALAHDPAARAAAHVADRRPSARRTWWRARCRRAGPAIALATISSDSPAEYTSAVSMKLMPASSAAWITAIDSSWSGLPHCAEHHRPEAQAAHLHARPSERPVNSIVAPRRGRSDGNYRALSAP